MARRIELWPVERLPHTVAVEAAPAVIDLGDVRDSAEVFINGRPAGVAFMRPYHVRTGGLFKPGNNTIEIRVSNLWNNAVMAMPRTVTRVPGPGYGIADVLYGPRERRLAPSGLLGPVRILR